MPMYTWSCACGWQGDLRAGWDESSRLCPGCGDTMARDQVYAVNHSGFAIPPMSSRRIDLDQAVNAQHEIVAAARRQGVPAPDLWSEAQRRAKHIQKHAPELVSGT